MPRNRKVRGFWIPPACFIFILCSDSVCGQKPGQLCIQTANVNENGYRVTVGRAGVREIDFICEKDGEKVYIQVAYLLASEETVQREFGAFDSVKDHFPKYVVSLDDIDMCQDGIHHKNMRDFLLMPSWR